MALMRSRSALAAQRGTREGPAMDESGGLRESGTPGGSVPGALPVDPGLSRYPADVGPYGALRFVSVDTAPSGTGEVEATAAADDPVTAGARLGSRVLQVLLGAPLKTTAIAQERMRKLVALPVLSADALSSVAYGPGGDARRAG